VADLYHESRRETKNSAQIRRYRNTHY
jgi:hypothetical protein